MSETARHAELDALTAHELRERGSLKWTTFDGDTIGAFVAEMDFGTAPPIVAALHAAVDAASLGYLPPGRRADLQAACAAWQHHRYGWEVDPAQVHPVADVLTAFEVAMRHFTTPGTPIILPTPAYMPFLTVPPRHGREVVEVPMTRDAAGRYELDLAGIDAAYRAGGELLVLCHPHNPVGRVLTRAELAAVTEVVERHRGRVFADEIHAPLVYPGHAHTPYASTSPEAAGHSLTAVSASKAWDLPGLKCAQVILTSPADGPIWEEVASIGSPAASTLGAVAATAAYRSGGPWLDEVVAYLDRNRQALAGLVARHLPGVGYRPPEGTYLAWLDVRPVVADRDGGPDRDLAGFLRERAGVAVVDGAGCGAAGTGQVRLTLATPLPILERAVTRMAHALAG